MTVMDGPGTLLTGAHISLDMLQSEYFLAVRTPSTPSVEALLRDYTGWVVLPERAAAPGSTLPRITQRCRELTGWSTRDLAEVLGTSHTTVRMFETDGRFTARSVDAASRVQPLLAVLSRLARVAGDRDRLTLALMTPQDSGERAMDLLVRQEWARAFTVGLDVLRGPRPEMLVPLDAWSASSGTREMR